MISRPQVMQTLLDLYKEPRYLEIGVHKGETFKSVRASRKVAVDPSFAFDYVEFGKTAKECEFNEVTSDIYFGSIVKPAESFDVIFLDGLHIAEQTIRDLLNAILFLQPKGVIVIDDVEPESYHSSLADMPAVPLVREFLAKRDPRMETDRAWMGDIYKLPFFIRTFLQQFSYASIADNHGQTVLWRESRSATDIVHCTLETLDRLQFKDLIRQYETLKSVPFAEIVPRVRDHVVTDRNTQKSSR